VLFTGQAELTIDAKQRLAIPAKYRAQWDPAKHGNAWICVPWPGGILRLYPEARFEQLAQTVQGTLIPDRDEAELEAALFGFAERLEMDSAGRVVLPRGHLERTALSGEVIVIGARDRLEVRDRSAWRSAEAERFNSLPELVARIQNKRNTGQAPRP
jgi:MraZ protein